MVSVCQTIAVYWPAIFLPLFVDEDGKDFYTLTWRLPVESLEWSIYLMLLGAAINYLFVWFMY